MISIVYYGDNFIFVAKFAPDLLQSLHCCLFLTNTSAIEKIKAYPSAATRAERGQNGRSAQNHRCFALYERLISEIEFMKTSTQ